MKKVSIEEAVGLPICHDMTRVVPGEFKGVAFKKGHIITKEDIPMLKSMGKENIYVGEIPEGFVHEDECARRIADSIASKDEFEFSEVNEGKINIKAKYDGLLKIDVQKLYDLNSIEHVSISTIYDNVVVSKGDKVASERIIPLFTREQNIKKVEELGSSGELLHIKPFIKQKVHLLITGNEVFKGIIKDRFYDALKPKVEMYGSYISDVTKAPDDKAAIKSEINNALEGGADIVICTGGMSVDEDDLTPIAIKEVADELIVHGVPVQPGNMFLLAYKDDVPIMGLPAAVMFHRYTIFDIVFPFIACKEKPEKEFFKRLSLGGLCHFCSECHYPNCTFGKGR